MPSSRDDPTLLIRKITSLKSGIAPLPPRRYTGIVGHEMTPMVKILVVAACITFIYMGALVKIIYLRRKRRI